MDIIIDYAHLLPNISTILITDIIILIALTTIIVLMLINGLGWTQARFKVTRLIQEAKMDIWEWLKFRDKSDKTFNMITRIKQSRREADISQGTTKGEGKGWKQLLGPI